LEWLAVTYLACVERRQQRGCELNIRQPQVDEAGSPLFCSNDPVERSNVSCPRVLEPEGEHLSDCCIKSAGGITVVVAEKQ
jgi:hypothetical protein